MRSRTEAAVIPEEDLIKLLRASKGAVLVGGQALAFWVAYFGLRVPAGPRTYISADADFLGFAGHVKVFSETIGGEAVYPRKGKITALHGAVSKKTKDGSRIGVDVLRSIVGVEAGGVEERAIDVKHPKDSSLQFKVMDPVDCMLSRIENLRRLAEKQNAVGIWQGNISIAACRAYVGSLIDAGAERKAIRAATAILKIAGTAPGLQVFRKYGIEPIDAIPIDKFLSEPFKRQQYARTVAQIAKLRDSYTPPPPSKKLPRRL